MLNIFVRIAKVDMDGYNGRDYHPTKDMEGSLVRITNMDTVPDDVDLDRCPECARLKGKPHTEFCPTRQGYQVFHGIVVDANGEDVEEGGEVSLVDHEIESLDGQPIFFTPDKA